MESKDPPKIPPSIVEWLESQLLARVPGPEASDKDAWAFLGQLALVRRLRRLAEEQINPPKDDDDS